MKARLLVDGVDLSRLVALLGKERGDCVNLETLDELVLNLNLGLEHVGSSPGLREGEAVLLVGPLALKVTLDSVRASSAAASDLERHVGWRLGLHLKGVTSEREILSKEVVRRLSEVLRGFH